MTEVIRTTVDSAPSAKHSKTTVKRANLAAPFDPEPSEGAVIVEGWKAASRLDEARAAVDALKDHLCARFLEREEEIDGIAAALVAREHVLLLGEPGTAKSELASAFCEALDGRFFQTLCTRFQTPEEVLGMFSLKAMQEDRYVRQTTNRIPEADVAFLDEVFKGSAAMLNTLLRVLNERSFEQDGVALKIPLRLVVAASNELPDEQDGLGAFHDRFLVRFEVKRLQQDDSARAVLFGGLAGGAAPRVTPEQLAVLAAAADAVEVTADAQEAVLKVRSALHEKGVRVSDRRWRKTVGLMRAQAAISGQSRVTSASLGILEHCLWERPEQIPTVRECVRAHVATWIKATREAHAALDEQIARIQEAGRKGGRKHEAISQLAKSLDALVDVDKAMEDLLREHPEADGDVVKVRARIAKAKGDVNAAMRVHGIGV